MAKSLKKILIIQQAPDWGGAEEWMNNLVNIFIQKNISIIGYTNLEKLRKLWEKSGAETYNIPYILDIIGNIKGFIKSIFYSPFAICFYLQILSKAKNDKVDLILMSGFSEKLLVTWLAKFFNLSVVWFEYGPLQYVFKKNFYIPKFLYNLTCHLPIKIFTISQHTKKNLLQHSKISSKKIKLIYPGVYIPIKTSFINKPIVGCLSRLAPEKGQRLLIQAWPKVVQAVPRAKLKIAGSGSEVVYLKKLAKKLNLSNSIEFLGFIKNKKKFYKSLAVFVFPSIWNMEGFGIVAAEALAYAKPVIAFNSGPSPEIINNSVGRLVNSQNIDQLAKEIISLLKNYSQRKKLSSNTQLKASKQFNFLHQADKIISNLHEIIKTI